jgi:hypothetical protein
MDWKYFIVNNKLEITVLFVSLVFGDQLIMSYLQIGHSRYHFALKLSYAKLMLCYGKIVSKFINSLKKLLKIIFLFKFNN